jgi:hypothetical protein
MKLIIYLLHSCIGVLSAAMSWSVNHSICWAVFHWIVSVIYIPYWILRYSGLIDWIGSLVVR